MTRQDSNLIDSLKKFRCSPEMRAMLSAEVSNDEIKNIIFALRRNKSPGPDGYNAEFLRASWSIIGPKITSAVKEFFTAGKILRQWNCTAITLIPKSVNASKITEFRPISLCNVLYKVISKVIATRLETVLPEIISPHQSAFVKGRLLIENVLLATELVQNFNQANVSARGVLKVDLRKAFDSLKWEFILRVLRVANFPEVFVNWIQQCITTPSFSINVNGDLCGFFEGKQGIRQGDPISPYLFVIAMEVFASLVQTGFNSGSIKYHPKAQNPNISHLAFADDVMVFFDGSSSSLEHLTATLEVFHRLSGLEMNREKSALYTSGLTEDQTESLAAFGFTVGTFPFRYLGLPLTHRKLRRSEYTPLFDSISARFNHWTTKVLSFAGRLQLVSSVIYSTVNFWISAFLLPKSCLKTIEAMCNHFLWAGDISKKHGVKVAWHQICLPKEEGGLGLRNFSLWNMTLNLKLIWLLFSKSDSLWVAWMRNHYLRQGSFWNAPIRTASSWIWKTMLSLRPLTRRFLRCYVSDGQSSSFWFDHWLDMGPLIDVVGQDGPQLMGIPI